MNLVGESASSSIAPKVSPSSRFVGPGAVNGIRPPLRSSTNAQTSRPSHITTMPNRRPMEPSAVGMNNHW